MAVERRRARPRPGFNWDVFFGVARWALLAYGVIAAMLEFVFIHDGTRGGKLVVLTLSLAVFAVHVPLLIGFTVARYQPPEGAGAGELRPWGGGVWMPQWLRRLFGRADAGDTPERMAERPAASAPRAPDYPDVSVAENADRAIFGGWSEGRPGFAGPAAGAVAVLSARSRSAR